MEYCPYTLERLLKDLPAKVLPEDEAARLFYELVKAVEYLHGKSIIHRDLKPANILLTRDRKIKLGDFGWAKLISADIGKHSFCVTPYYRAPEV